MVNVFDILQTKRGYLQRLTFCAIFENVKNSENRVSNSQPYTGVAVRDTQSRRAGTLHF